MKWLDVIMVTVVWLKMKMMGGGKVKRAMYKDGGMPKAKPC
jgi:hypothetical protein